MTVKTKSTVIPNLHDRPVTKPELLTLIDFLTHLNSPFPSLVQHALDHLHDFILRQQDVLKVQVCLEYVVDWFVRPATEPSFKPVMARKLSELSSAISPAFTTNHLYPSYFANKLNLAWDLAQDALTRTCVLFVMRGLVEHLRESCEVHFRVIQSMNCSAWEEERAEALLASAVYSQHSPLFCQQYRLTPNLPPLLLTHNLPPLLLTTQNGSFE